MIGTRMARRDFLLTAGVAGLFTGIATAAADAASALEAPVLASATAIDLSSLPRVKQKLVAPPFAPEHEQVATTGPSIIEIELVIEEKQVEIDGDGTKTWAFAYNGSVPGPLIVCHVAIMSS